MIQLNEAAIEQAIPLVSRGLGKYCRLQADLATTDVANDRAFQTRFNAFYRIRRNANWRRAFYSLFQQEKSEARSFDCILRALYDMTGRIESSFASKLAASIDPGKPVIDSIVLKNLDLRLMRSGSAAARLARIAELHNRIGLIFSDFLSTGLGRYLITRFEESYSDRHLTHVKMLDLILWQTR